MPALAYKAPLCTGGAAAILAYGFLAQVRKFIGPPAYMAPIPLRTRLHLDRRLSQTRRREETGIGGDLSSSITRASACQARSDGEAPKHASTESRRHLPWPIPPCTSAPPPPQPDEQPLAQSALYVPKALLHVS